MTPRARIQTQIACPILSCPRSRASLSVFTDLRQLSVSSPEATQALLEEGVDLGLLHGRGQIHGVQRAGVLVAARPGEGEGDHRRLLPLGQEVQEGEPHSPVLEDEEERRVRTDT